MFGFGAVLYEMVTGRRAFSGGSLAERRAAVLTRQPKPASDVVGGVPQQLERLIQRCLRKEPDRRYQHILDVKVELEEIRESGSAVTPKPAKVGRKTRVVAALLAGVVLLAVGAWLARSRVGPPLPLRVEPLTATAGLEWAPTFSPDGQQVAFAWDGEKGAQYDIYVKMVGSSEVLRLTTDPEGEYWPAWSPDGRQIAFLRYSHDEGRIYVVSPLGGTARRVSDFPFAGPLDWSPDGKWLAAWRPASASGAQPAGIWLIPTAGGEPRLLAPALPEGDVRAPAVSPDGRQLAYASCVSRQPPTPCDVHVLRLDAQLVPQGAPRRLTRQAFSIGRLAWARDGRSILYDAESGPYTLYLWRVSVDGERWDIWTIGVEGGPPLRLTHHPGDENVPSWSRDGRWVYFGSERDGAPGIFRVPAEGGGEERLTRTDVVGGAQESVDGRTLFFKRGRGSTALVALSLAGGSEKTLVLCVDGFPGFAVAQDGLYYVP